MKYECAMTGLTEDSSFPSTSDKLDDLPVNWYKVTMSRRRFNPKWVAIQQVKEATLEALLSQFPEEVRDLQRMVVQIQVEAQMKALELDTPMYLDDLEDVVYLSDSPEILGSINEMRENLGLEAIESDEEVDDEDESDNENE